MPDETARILDAHGTPTARAEYAIHEAHRHYREATAAGDALTAAAWLAARIARRDALTDALLRFDFERYAMTEPDNYVTGNARDTLAADRAAIALAATDALTWITVRHPA